MTGSKEQRSRLWLGTSGLVLPLPNKQAFPDEFRAGTRLTYYASLFNSIEINSSFYKVPQPATLGKWSHEVPEDFRFTIKLWQGITHVPELHFIPIDVNRFMHAADQLGAKKGCLLIQLPPKIKANRTGQLERLLDRILQADPQHSWRLAVEFRDKTWYRTEVETLLRRYHATWVLHDMPTSKIMRPAGTTSFVYLRFHGPAGDYKGGYGEESLKEFAGMVKNWMHQGIEAYVYFNNTIGDAIADANLLRRLCTGHSGFP